MVVSGAPGFVACSLAFWRLFEGVIFFLLVRSFCPERASIAGIKERAIAPIKLAAIVN